MRSHHSLASHEICAPTIKAMCQQHLWCICNYLLRLFGMWCPRGVCVCFPATNGLHNICPELPSKGKNALSCSTPLRYTPFCVPLSHDWRMLNLASLYTSCGKGWILPTPVPAQTSNRFKACQNMCSSGQHFSHVNLNGGLAVRWECEVETLVFQGFHTSFVVQPVLSGTGYTFKKNALWELFLRTLTGTPTSCFFSPTLSVFRHRCSFWVASTS